MYYMRYETLVSARNILINQIPHYYSNSFIIDGPAPLQRTILIPIQCQKALDRVNSSRFSSDRSRLLAFNKIRTLSNTAVLREVQIQAAVIPSRAKHNNAECQDRNEKHIQDTKEHEAISNGNLVPTIIKTVRNRVQKPEKHCPASKHGIVALDPQALGGQEAAVKEGSSKQEVGEGAVGVEAPLVVCSCHGAGEPGGDPGPGESDIECDGCPADAGDETKSDDERGPADKPGRRSILIAGKKIVRDQEECQTYQLIYLA